MPQYRRHYQWGGIYFFTVVTYERIPIFQDVAAVDLLRECFKSVMSEHPFIIDAIVVMPDHIHCIWSLHESDYDFSKRWKKIKSRFTRRYTAGLGNMSLCPTHSRVKKGEKGVWQRRFWEHTIRDDQDYQAHCDYIHYNPVKHGLVKRPGEWQHSSVHRFVEKGLCAKDWAAEPLVFPEGMGGE